MSSGARSAKAESKLSTPKAKYVRCKDCAYAMPCDSSEFVRCPYHGKVYKTNSCTRRKINDGL